MRHYLISLPASLALLSGCDRPAPDLRGVAHDETLLTVTATGVAESRPDEGRFSAGLSTVAATAAAASQQNNEKMQRITDALTGLGIAKADLKTQSLTVARNEWGADKGKYTASNMIEVRVRNVDRVGRAIAAATGAGANILSGPDLVNADPEKSALSSYGAAYKAARAKAEAYASASGLRITRILSISDAGGAGAPPPYRPVMAQTVAPPPVAMPEEAPVLPGTNRSQTTVRVDFALEPAG